MCVGAPAPSSTAPSIAVVKKMRFPHTIGEEWPSPGIGVFQRMFFVGLHSSGRFFSVEMPLPEGPRHCGQSAARPGTVKITTASSILIGINHFLRWLWQPEAAHEARDIDEQGYHRRGI